MKKKEKAKNYVILTFANGQAARLGRIYYAENRMEAMETVHKALYHTTDWQAIVYRWDDENQRAETLVAMYDTFPRVQQQRFNVVRYEDDGVDEW